MLFLNDIAMSRNKANRKKEEKRKRLKRQRLKAQANKWLLGGLGLLTSPIISEIISRLPYVEKLIQWFVNILSFE